MKTKWVKPLSIAIIVSSLQSLFIYITDREQDVLQSIVFFLLIFGALFFGDVYLENDKNKKD